MDNYHGRRESQIIEDQDTLLEILDSSDFGFIGLTDKIEPYVIPVNFTREKNFLYIHSARSGKKLEFIKINPNVCLNALADFEYLEGEGNYCYRSVIVYGQASLITDKNEMLKAYQILCSKIDPLVMEHVNDDCLNRSLFIKIEISKITGKHGVEKKPKS